ncbi:MAG: hypothetical protein QOD42_10 [Sphingomonadales bacterium]|jgi:hypothetical protein|nr:hypothetical protein [Sphingomonadales bacterium]
MPPMPSVIPLLATALAFAPPAGAGVSRCLGAAVPVSGLRAAVLDDEAVAALRRFARAHRGDDYRIRYVVFAPYGFDRGTTSNILATRLRGEVIRAHLVGAGLDEDRIRVLQLGEHADYPFPPGTDAVEAAARRRLDLAGRWTTAASVTVESPAGAAPSCPPAALHVPPS